MAIPDTVGLMIAWVVGLSLPGSPPVSAEIPDPLTEDHVQVRRLGGPALPPVRDQPLIHLSSWAPTDKLALDRLNIIRPQMWALVGTATLGVTVYELDETAGPTSTTDPQGGRPFAFMRWAVTVRANDIIHQFS